MSQTREGATFFSDAAADLVMDLAAKLDRREPVYLWWGNGRREVWAKVTAAWRLTPPQPEWRRYGICYDLGPRCRGWPRPDGSPSVRPFVRDEVAP